jgi:hypothetical protein
LAAVRARVRVRRLRCEARDCHEVHREKPFGEVCARLVENCSSGRVNVVAAMLADIGPALGKGVKLGVNATARTHDFGPAVVHLHKLGETMCVSGVYRLKLLKGTFGHD